MFSALFDVVSLAAVPSLVVGILAQTELWQRKEYRLDRLQAAWQEPEPRQRVYIYLFAASLLSLGLPAAAVLTLALAHTYRLLSRGLFRPLSTKKAFLICSLSICLSLVLVWLLLSGLEPASAWAVTLLASPWLTSLDVAVMNLATHLRKQQVIRRARRWRQELPRLKVVGITGSFGKTSTKHFLAQLLPKSMATKEHRNSLYPVALDMLEQLKTDSSTYIVEMGAYKKGEIKALAQLTQPNIGIITAVGNQHLALFGSQVNILQAKWELIESLPADGVVILNADSQLLVQQIKTKIKSSRISHLIQYSAQRPADIYAANIKFEPRQIKCRLHIFNDKQNVVIPLAGEGALSNVLAAVAAAVVLETTPAEIYSRVSKLKPFPYTMEIKAGLNGAVVIDDSYSANESATLSALKHLQRFPQTDKRIILVPLIELGNESQEVHRRIGAAIKSAPVKAIVFGAAFRQELGLPHVTDPAELINRFKDLSEDSVVLLAGRLPAIVTKALLK